MCLDFTDAPPQRRRSVHAFGYPAPTGSDQDRDRMLLTLSCQLLPPCSRAGWLSRPDISPLAGLRDLRLTPASRASMPPAHSAGCHPAARIVNAFKR